MSNPLVELQKLGQSPWHDNIRRGLLTGGQLQKMIAAGDITGLTSNPTIFEQAILKSTDYQDEIVKLAKAGKNANDIFDALSVDDIRNAATLFTGVYERTKGIDGYVSIEVNPLLGHDTAKTVAEAKRLWGVVDRPNLMVKIPATVEGLPAIEESIAAGFSINVTLIFSLERHNQVMQAYLNGLEKRVKAGLPIDRIASVASFFVSRVDTLIDKLLDQKIQAEPAKKAYLESLQGKAGIANAKMAFAGFRKSFSGPRWDALKLKGAQLQRPLWASTSTKNPKYPDVYYVEALVGPDSVDTMPPATIDAYRDHGKPKVQIESDVAGAEKVIKDLAAVGVDMAVVTKQLEDEGVASFSKSFDSLMDSVEKARKAAVGK